jgi:predicted thioesterase
LLQIPLGSASIIEGTTMQDVKPGAVGHAEMVVGTNDTAPRVGTGRIAVLATPVMINLMEEAALACVEHLLPEGKQSLGTRIDVTHIAATPIGMRVRATAKVAEVQGRKVLLEISAFDEKDLIGEGRHERVVVTVANFQARIDDKARSR